MARLRSRNIEALERHAKLVEGIEYKQRKVV